LRRSFNPWLIVMLIILGIFVFNQFSTTGAPREITYTSFIQLVDEGRVATATIERTNGVIEGVLTSETQVIIDGEPQTVRNFRVVTVINDSLIQRLEQNVGQVAVRNPPQWIGLLISFLPFLLLILIFWFFFMRAQGGPNQVMQFGQSKAKTYGRENKVSTTFVDVAGHAEAKQELKEVVDFLKHPQKYLRIGAEIPKGVLLVGPPGTGKTLLARAVAGEAGVPFLTVSASEFMEMFVGVGASRVRSLFEEARKASPAIIFIDELDSIGRRRGAGIGGGHDEREQTLNQILSEMDGFEKDTSVIIIAATNRPDILDPALMRPGRFDRQVTIGLPTQREREDILKVHVRNKPVAEDVDLRRLAEATPMFSGADLENLTNEAALVAARSDKQIIHWDDFNEALDRITLGLRRGSLVPTEQERKILAYHESGHAVAYAAQPELGEIRKVTISPRGGAGGFMAPLAKEELFFNEARFLAQLVVAFGGRVAEKRVTGTISSGASNDLKQATEMAKQMVLDLGMGGQEFVAWGSDSGPVFLGGEISRRKDFSEETARELEGQVTRILQGAYSRTEGLIGEHWPAVEAVAQALLKVETIDGKLVAEAYRRSEAGEDATVITAWLIEQVQEHERRVAAASERDRVKAEAREEGRSTPAPSKRPATEGSRP
jgi:cell division protease FtsH